MAEAIAASVTTMRHRPGASKRTPTAVLAIRLIHKLSATASMLHRASHGLEFVWFS
jgi:hypothetical protein